MDAHPIEITLWNLKSREQDTVSLPEFVLLGLQLNTRTSCAVFAQKVRLPVSAWVAERHPQVHVSNYSSARG